MWFGVWYVVWCCYRSVWCDVEQHVDRCLSGILVCGMWRVVWFSAMWYVVCYLVSCLVVCGALMFDLMWSGVVWAVW